MRLFVLISTLDEGVRKIPDMLLPPQEGVLYVVVWQRTGQGETSSGSWSGRDDVTLVEMGGKGLCRSRNRAIQTAMEQLTDSLEDAVFVIADDDELFTPEAFQRIRDIYERYNKLDAALFRLRSSVDNQYFKRYPESLISYSRRPRYYYPCSLELTLRSRVFVAGVRFDERFGLGAEKLCAGEEDVLLTDLTRRGFKVLIVPEDIGTTDPATTGDRVLDGRVLRSKGAVYGYQMPKWRALLRCCREALSLAWRNHTSMWPLLRQLWYGVKYVTHE